MRIVLKSLICLGLFHPFLAHAAPEGFQLIAGDASPPVQDGQKWTINSASNAIIQWDSFSIDAAESVRFQQMTSDSAVLNRVTGLEQSALLGSLLSNGCVYLLNPNGVLIGPDARIDAASFLASTLDVLDEAFLKRGHLNFTNAGPGRIVNLGTINCPDGDIILLAKTVSNQGQMNAENGYAGIGVGTEILIRPEGTQRIYIKGGETAEQTIEGAA